MAKKIKCVVPGCSWEHEAPTEDALIQKVAEHAGKAHGVTSVPPELLKQVKAAIKDA